MKEAQRSYELFIAFIKNTEIMVKSIFTQNKFENDLSLQIGILNDMIEGLESLKEDLSNILKENKKNIDVN